MPWTLTFSLKTRACALLLGRRRRGRHSQVVQPLPLHAIRAYEYLALVPHLDPVVQSQVSRDQPCLSQAQLHRPAEDPLALQALQLEERLYVEPQETVRHSLVSQKPLDC